MAEPPDLFSALFARMGLEERRRIALRSGPESDEDRFLDETPGSILIHAAEQLSIELHAEGVRPGDRIGWIGWNDPAQLMVLAACARLGTILVPLNWRLSVEDLRWIEADASFRILFAPIGQERARLTFRHPYIEDFRDRRRPRGPFAWRDSGDPAEGAVLDDPLDWQLVYQDGSFAEALAALPPPVAASAPLLLCYTSGSTGRPKGAVLSQAAVAANAAHAQAIFGFTPADTVLTVLPMFHAGGLNIQTLPALLAGADVILHRRFDPDRFFDALALWRPTLTLLVPTVMRALVEHPRWATAELSCLRAVGAGSSEVPVELIRAFHARGVPVQQVYGATETGPIAIAQDRAEALAAPGSLGRPVGGVQCRLGADGEILLRGPNLMTGYWDGAAQAVRPLGEDWFVTGDLGRVDAAGRWWFAGRRSDVIISGGENIWPAELERVLESAPGVLECAVCGRPDPVWGEVPVAVLAVGPGFSYEAILAHTAAQLARFKQPRGLVVVPALPRTALGKLDRAALRRLACGAGAPSAGD